MESNLDIKIRIDLVTLKLIEEGATLLRDNDYLSRKDRPELQYRMVDYDRFIREAISEKYNNEKARNLLLTKS